jgi:hypothetical protein
LVPTPNERGRACDEAIRTDTGIAMGDVLPDVFVSLGGSGFLPWHVRAIPAMAIFVLGYFFRPFDVLKLRE